MSRDGCAYARCNISPHDIQSMPAVKHRLVLRAECRARTLECATTFTHLCWRLALPMSRFLPERGARLSDGLQYQSRVRRGPASKRHRRTLNCERLCVFAGQGSPTVPQRQRIALLCMRIKASGDAALLGVRGALSSAGR